VDGCGHRRRCRPRHVASPSVTLSCTNQLSVSRCTSHCNSAVVTVASIAELRPLTASGVVENKSRSFDVGCSLTCGAFELGQNDDQLRVETCEEWRALIFFALRLFRRLQLMGTVSAINISRYRRVVWT